MRTERKRRDLRREKAAEAGRLFRMAYARQLDGELDQAFVLYEKSIRLHATAEAHVHLGWALATREQVEEAIEQCRQAIQLDADFANPWNDIGAYYIELDRPEDALFFLKKAVRMRSYALRCYPHYNLHRAYLALGDRERAVSHLHESLGADPDFGPALAALSELLFPGGPVESLDDEMDDCLRAGTPVLALPPR